MDKKTIAVDFDGVIHRYSKGWLDGSIYDPPVSGAAEALYRLKRAGYRVLIFTTRASNRNIDGVEETSQLIAVAEYLEKHEIPYDAIFAGEKPMYTAIIDDRAIRFDPRPPWWKTIFGLKTAWDLCIDQLERLGILKPGQGEEP